MENMTQAIAADTGDAVKAVASVQFRSPSTLWAKDDFKHRAYITVNVATCDGEIRRSDVTIGRNFYRGGERTYRNVSAASLARIERLFPFPIGLS